MKKKIPYYIFISWGSAALLLLMLYFFSSQPAADSHDISSVLSDRLFSGLKPTFDFIRRVADYPLSTFVAKYVRKTAHFLIFLSISVVLYHCFRSIRLRRPLCYVFSLVICMCGAMLDEYHQSFVEGRGSQWSDVWIDCAGALTGLLFVCLVRMTGTLYVKAYVMRLSIAAAPDKPPEPARSSSPEPDPE